MTGFSFLTNHARVLVCIAGDPDVRLRDVAAKVDITERSAYQIVTDLITAGYVAKERDGRRNRYHVHADRRLREPTAQERTVGELLGLLVAPTDEHEHVREPAGRHHGPSRATPRSPSLRA